MNGETLLHSAPHNVHTLHLICYSLLAATGLSPLLLPSLRLFKQRNWATEDQTEFLSSVLLVGQLDGIIPGSRLQLTNFMLIQRILLTSPAFLCSDLPWHVMAVLLRARHISSEI